MIATIEIRVNESTRDERSRRNQLQFQFAVHSELVNADLIQRRKQYRTFASRVKSIVG